MIEQVDFYVPAAPREPDGSQTVVPHEDQWQWAIQNGGVYGYDPDESGVWDHRPETDPPGQLPNLWLWPHGSWSAPTIKLRTGGSSRYAKIVCPLVEVYQPVEELP